MFWIILVLCISGSSSPILNIIFTVLMLLHVKCFILVWMASLWERGRGVAVRYISQLTPPIQCTQTIQVFDRVSCSALPHSAFFPLVAPPPPPPPRLTHWSGHSCQSVTDLWGVRLRGEGICKNYLHFPPRKCLNKLSYITYKTNCFFLLEMIHIATQLFSTFYLAFSIINPRLFIFDILIFLWYSFLTLHILKENTTSPPTKHYHYSEHPSCIYFRQFIVQ